MRLCIAIVFCIFSAIIQIPAAPVLSGEFQGPAYGGRTVAEWFQRAGEQMNPRLPGSAPFQMKVTFHAFPGDEVLGPKEKPQIATGDGTYQETWLAPHKWRREVAFGSYHAVEVEGDGGRKFQSNSDYEPGRILMLLTALYDPVPRVLLPDESPVYRDKSWSIGPVSLGALRLVNVQSAFSLSDRSAFVERDRYFFLPKGPLVLAQINGLLTTWQDEALFAGKVVPKRISIRAPATKPGEPDRNLLTAEVTIEPVSRINAATFELPCAIAEPGMTMRPIYRVDKPAQPLTQLNFHNHQDTRVQLMSELDRTGSLREVEVIRAQTVEGTYELHQLVGAIRSWRFAPAEIDGSRCEIPHPIDITTEHHVDSY